MKKNLLLSLAFAVGVIGTTSAQTWDLPGNVLLGAEQLGSINAQPLNLVTNNTSRLFIRPDGRIGINTQAPGYLFTIKNNGTDPIPGWVTAGNPFLVAYAESNTGDGDMLINMATNIGGARPTIFTRRSRGTLDAPAAVINNDFLGSLLASGYDGASFQNPALINFLVDGVPSQGNVPARISLITGSNGGNRKERLKVGSTGNFDFNFGQITLTEANGNVGIGLGNLNFRGALQTIQFPTVPSATNSPMINMFSSGTQNNDRMVIAHSPAFTNWGLQYQDSTDKFNFLSGGTPVMTTDLGSRRVGIGTATPDTRLDIAGTGVWDLASTEGDFRLGNATYRLKMGVANSGGGAGDAYIASAHRLYLGAGTTLGRTQTMSINSNGRVGIGTFTPTARLQVVGDTLPVAAISARTSYVGNSDVRGVTSFSKPADGWGYGVEGTGGFIGGYFSGSAGAYSGTGYGVFGTASGTAGTRIGVYGSASGGTVENWGGYFATKTYTNELRVGTTNGATGYIVSVGGRLIAEEVRVELEGNWPDYVFDKGYKLMPLEELEKKVNTDKHLPGIPTATEMKEDGILLGQMQTKTMEKVEENTLYIIQLNNKIKQLEKIIDELIKKNK